MKLGSLRSGGRDGTLVVIDRQIGRAVRVPEVAETLQQAIENWTSAAPRLQDVYRMLCAGEIAHSFAIEKDALTSPLPRSYQFLDGSVYLHHMKQARAARGAPMPPHYETEPVMYQGLSDAFRGPFEPVSFPSDDLEIDYEAEIAVILDDVPMGVDRNAAGDFIRLAILLNDYTLRALTRTELPKGFGFLQSKPTSSFSPVAVTLDELGGAWDGSRFHLQVSSMVNGRVVGTAASGHGMYFDYPDLIAHAARTRTLSAGTILGAGSISNPEASTGAGCIAEARFNEEVHFGTPQTPFLRFGDRIHIEAFDANGESAFGAIDQEIVGPT